MPPQASSAATKPALELLLLRTVRAIALSRPKQHQLYTGSQTHCLQGKKTWGSVEPPGPGETKPWPNPNPPNPPPNPPPSNPRTRPRRTSKMTYLGRGSYSARVVGTIGLAWPNLPYTFLTTSVSIIHTSDRCVAECF
ncbi:hypothetical protein BKA64DRAFT_703568 [Cadophora sp. MPI-SDFR-AT-0126]|nr:hypothetical protein BKA64DRAFT_703568 [Leotiomycetes sp. MPI-SDFR-AT-0126]